MGKLTSLQKSHELFKSHHYLIHAIKMGTMTMGILNLNKTQFLSHLRIEIIFGTSLMLLSETSDWSCVSLG